MNTPEQKVRRAKTIATKAINKAAQEIAQDGSRSTRTRAAYKIKAEALDRIALVLTGKE